MSSEELPVELDKLKIAPTLPTVKLIGTNFPLSLNPFYDEQIQLSESESSQNQSVKPLRRCRFRRKSESCLDDHRESSSIDHAHTSQQIVRSTPRVHKMPLKKISPTVSTRKILREPILRTLQSCIQHANRRLSQPVQDLKRSSSKGSISFNDTTSAVSSFSETDLNELGGVKLISSSIKSPIAGLKFSKGEIATCSSNPITLDSIKVQSLDLIPATQPRGNTSTCSQQAGNGSISTGSCDDVTIDELASYLDAIVHIPKKMSTMAEMMYI